MFNFEDDATLHVIETKLRSSVPNPKCNDSAFASLNCIRIAHSLPPTELEDMVADATMENIFSLPAALNIQHWMDLSQTLELPVFQRTLSTVHMSNNISSASEAESLFSDWFKPYADDSVSAIVVTSNTVSVPLLRIHAADESKTLFAIMDCRPSHAGQIAFMFFDTLQRTCQFLYDVFNAASSTGLSARLLAPVDSRRDLQEADLMSETTRFIHDQKNKALPDAPDSNKSSNPPATSPPRLTVQPPADTTPETTLSDTPSPDPSSSGSRRNRTTPRKRRGEFDWQLSLLNPSALPSSTAPKPQPAAFKVDIAMANNPEPEPEIAPAPPQQNEFACLKPLLLAAPLSYPIGGIMEDGLDLDGPAPDPPGANDDLLLSSKANGNGHHLEVKDEHVLLQKRSRSEFGWQLGLLGGSKLVSSLSPRKSRPKAIDASGSSVSLAMSVVSPLESAIRQTKDDVVTPVDPKVESKKDLLGGSSREEDSSSEAPKTAEPPTDSKGSETRPPEFAGVWSSRVCGVCADEFEGEGQLVKIQPCLHAFCRPCLNSFIAGKLGEQKYPLVCPTCATDSDRGQKEKGSIDKELMEQLNLSQSKLDKFTQLHLDVHGVLLHCPRCIRSSSVDRAQLEKDIVVQCPLPDCGYRWCKACLKAVTTSENHKSKCKQLKTDGTLKRRKGYGICPTCRTLVQKQPGYNHITCSEAFCQTHFCYKCEQLISDGKGGADVSLAIAKHYENCKLFEKDKCIIQ